MVKYHSGGVYLKNGRDKESGGGRRISRTHDRERINDCLQDHARADQSDRPDKMRLKFDA
jgi:hypothetical protein